MSGDDLGRTAPRGADRVRPRLGRRFGSWLAGPSALELHVGLYVVAATALVMLNLALAPDQFAVWRPLLWWAAGAGLHTVWVVVDGARRAVWPRPAAAGWLATAERAGEPARRIDADRPAPPRLIGLAARRTGSLIVASRLRVVGVVGAARQTSRSAWHEARLVAGWDGTEHTVEQGTPLGHRVDDRVAARQANGDGVGARIVAVLLRLLAFAVARPTTEPARQTDWSPAGNEAEPTGRFAGGWTWPAGAPAEATWETAFVSEATLALWTTPAVSPALRWDAAAEPAVWSIPPAADRVPAPDRRPSSPKTPPAALAAIAGGRDVVLDAPRPAAAERQDWGRMEADATAWLAHRQRTIADEPLLDPADHTGLFPNASQD